MVLSHNGSNPNESYTILLGISVRSCTPTGNLNPISTRRLDDRDDKKEKHRLRLQELEALDDKRLQTQQQIELYQARITIAFNKKVKERTFKKGDLVLAVRRSMVMTHKTKRKFQSKWEGSFIVESVYSNGAYRLIASDGDMLMMPINDRFLKKYYP